MKKKYINPQADELEMTPQFILAQSTSVDGTGQDFGSPTIMSADDFNSLFYAMQQEERDY